MITIDEILLDHVEGQSIQIGDGTNILDILERDAPSGGGENGIMSLGIRMDASGSPVSADGDYHPLVFNANGELKTSTTLDQTSNTALQVTKKSVSNVSALLLGANLVNRREITIQNLGAQDIFINETTAVAADDFKIPKRASATYSWGDAIDVAAVTAAATADVRILESA